MKRVLIPFVAGLGILLLGCSPAAQPTTAPASTATKAPAATATTAPAPTATTAPIVQPTATVVPATATTVPATATTAPKPTPTPIALSMDATEFKFSVTTLEVAVGQKVTLTLNNKGPRFPHNIAFHGYDALNTQIATPVPAVGASKTVDLTFDKPGYYPYYCPIGAHENAGMVGMLRVTGPSTGPATIKVRAPKADAVVRGSPASVTVSVIITGFELDKAAIGSATNKPGTGHWHVLLDGALVSPVGDVFTTLQNVAVGTHTLKVELHNNDHSPVTPAVADTISFKVEPPNTPTPVATATKTS